MADVYDEMINEYNKQKTATQTQINNLATEKQNILNTYEQDYNQQLTDYNNLIEQQRGNIDTWAEQQRQTQQAQTDFNLGLVEQQKQEAQKQTNAEIGNAYIDYQRGLNQFGGSAETLASQGLGGTGFAKNQDIAMNITYQNRVATAKSALMKANQDYDNQMQQARLNNDAQLAEIAYKQMQQQYALALQGFEYKTTMQNNRLNYIQSINDSYFSKTNTLQGRIDNYTSSINSVKAAKQQAAEQAAQQAANRAWEREKFYTQINNSNLGGKYDDLILETQYYKGSYNSDALTNGKVDPNKVFSNGYQPNNVNGAKLSKSGLLVSNVFGNKLTGKTGANLASQKIWKAGSKYYVWDGSVNSYQDVTKQVNQYKLNQPTHVVA